MDDQGSLHRRFLAHLRADQEKPEVELEGRLRALLAAGRAAWPALQLPDDEVLRYLAGRMPREVEDLCGALSALHAEDLYLACACVLLHPQALPAFERHCFAGLPAALSRLSQSAELHDEVRQQVRVRLFVSGPGGRRRIEEYAGRGPLSAWVRIVAVRIALDLLRLTGRQPLPMDGEALRHAALAADPELGLLSTRYHGDVEAAFQGAFATLDAADRNLLRLHHLDGLTLDEIGAMKRMHRSMVARRIARCREQVAARTRDALVERLGLAPSQIESIIRLVRSQLDLGMGRWLGQGAGR